MSKVYGSTALPKNFAQLLLNCEIQIELNEIIPKEIVIEILQLYSKGMEYFQSIHSYKYMYFERKLNAIMRSPKIIKSMGMQKQKQEPKKQPDPTRECENTMNLSQDDKIKIMQAKHKYEKMYNDFIGQTSTLTGDKIKKIVADNELKLTQVKQSIKDQISQQERRLQLKIERRKFQRATKKSMSSTELQKSTRDSLFNESQPEMRENLEVDFTKIINQNEVDSDDETFKEIKMQDISLQNPNKNQKLINQKNTEN